MKYINMCAVLFLFCLLCRGQVFDCSWQEPQPGDDDYQVLGGGLSFPLDTDADVCYQYVKLGLHFINDTNGTGFFTEDGNAGWTLPEGYSGYDYADDLEAEINRILANNQPLNTNDGWFYKSNEAEYPQFYDPNHPVPNANRTGIQFKVVSVDFWNNDGQSQFSAVNNPSAGSDYVAGDLNASGVLELYLFPAGDRNFSAYQDSYLRGQKNKTGTESGAIALHEIMHSMGVGHSYGFKPDGGLSICTQDCNSLEGQAYDDCASEAESACTGCPVLNSQGEANSTVYELYGEGLQGYVDQAESIGFSSLPLTYFGADPESCAMEAGTQGEDEVGLRLQLRGFHIDSYIQDVPPNFNCGAGIWGVDADPQYQFQYIFCDDPEEISNNIMDYGYNKIPVNISSQQIGKLQYWISTHGSFVLSEEAIWETYFPQGQILCPGAPVVTGLNPDIYSFSWAYNGSAGEGLYVDLPAGTYQVLITAEDASLEGCSIAQLVEITIQDTIGCDCSTLDADDCIPGCEVFDESSCQCLDAEPVTCDPNCEIYVAESCSCEPVEAPVCLPNCEVYNELTCSCDTAELPVCGSCEVLDEATCSCVAVEAPVCLPNCEVFNEATCTCDTVEPTACGTCEVYDEASCSCVAVEQPICDPTCEVFEEATCSCVVFDPALSPQYIDGAEVDGVTIWESGVYYVDGLITLEVGDVLQIQNGTEVNFLDADAGVLVKSGGELSVSGASVLQADPCNIGQWRGIDVERTSLSLKAIVEITENSTVQQAYHGLRLLARQIPVADVSQFTIRLNDARFINNTTGVYLKDVTRHDYLEIAECIFHNDDPFYNSPESPFIQLSVHSSNGVLVQSSRFSVDTESLSVDQRGLGVFSVESTVDIGGAKEGGNHFEGLFKAVDAYGLQSLRSARVRNNTFIDNIKAVSIRNTSGSVVAFNSFVVPERVDVDTDAWGVNMIESSMYVVNNNGFGTSGDAFLGVRAMISDNSNHYDEPNGVWSEISSNTVDGSFEQANLFKGDNLGVELFCNDIRSAEIGWHILPGARLGDQGLDLPFAGRWSSDPNQIDILNEAYDPSIPETVLTIIAEPGSEPEESPGVVSEIFGDSEYSVPSRCSFFGSAGHQDETNEGDSDDNCNLVVPDDVDDAKRSQILAKEASKYNIRGEEDCAMELLSQDTQNWTKFTRAVNHLSNQDTLQTEQILEEIVPENDRDVELKQFYSSMLASGTGKQSDQHAMVNAMQRGQKGSANITLGESAMALLEGRHFTRSYKTSSSTNVGTDSSPQLFFQPNPASEKVRILFGHLPLDGVVEITLFASDGRLVLEQQCQSDCDVLEIQELQAGLYYVRLSQNNMAIANGKLLVK